MNPIFLFIVFLLIARAQSYQQPNFNFFPMVQNAELGTQFDSQPLPNPCAILFRISFDDKPYQHISEVLKQYQSSTFGCHVINLVTLEPKDVKLINFLYVVNINIEHPELKSALIKNQQRYELNVTKEGASIKSETYVGFLRAIQTFYQVISCSENNKIPCKLTHLPMKIIDYPQFDYRGIMIDTARHYLPKKIILQTIDAMMYNKMNILHWHISDDDSFPLLLKSHPQITTNAAFSHQQIYTSEDVKQIVEYAMVRGVRVVPELSTPSHTSSWVKAQKNKNLSLCSTIFQKRGGFNLEDNKTFQIIKDVFTEIFQLFPDPMVHLGGQKIPKQCFSNPSQVDSIHKQYRLRQRQILKQIDSNKIFIYWQETNFEGQSDDIIHWTGNGFPSTSNKIIVSKELFHRLDTGVGDQKGYRTDMYRVWMAIYQYNLAQEINDYNNKDNVLGASMLLWGHTSNEYTHHTKVWMRSSCLAERLWNSHIQTIKPNVLRRITRHQRIIDRRGIPSAPVTCQQCEFTPENC